MREIKFRAWDGVRLYHNVHEWGEGEFWRKLKGETFDDLLHSDWKVMQYTGLEDKNGNEIYEGDVIEYVHDGIFRRSRKRVDWIETTQYTGWNVSKGRNGCQWEVIGNMWENSELVK